MAQLPTALKTKPAFKLLLPFMFGLTLNYFFELNPKILFSLLFLLFVLVAVSFSKRLKLYSIVINLIFIAALILGGALRHSLVTNYFPKNHIKYFMDSNQRLKIVGQVCGYPNQKIKNIEVELRIDSLIFNQKAYSTTGKVLLKIKDVYYQPRFGDSLQLFAKLRAPNGERNPGEFNYRRFLASREIYGLVSISKNQEIQKITPATGFSSERLFCTIKAKIIGQINQLYSNQAGALIKGLILGERGEIPAELRESFVKSGVIHALAISGLHVGYILIILFAIFGMLRVPPRAKIVLVLVGILFYNLLVGFKPPIVRASLMATIFLIGKLLQKQTDMLNIISIAALIILLIKPVELFQASFQLSFCAILSIVYLYRRLKIIFEKSQLIRKFKQNKICEYIYSLFLVSLAAQLGTFPIVVYYFHRVPVISIVVNLLVIPIVGIVIAYGFTSIIFSFIYFPLAQLFSLTNTLILNFLLFVINSASQLFFSSFDFVSIGNTAIFLYYLFLWLLLNLNKKPVRKYAVFLILVAANFFVWKSVLQKSDWLEVIYFDVGQGDAALVKFPNGQNLLIDAGPNIADFDAGKYFLLPFFKRNDITCLNTVILSHTDNDHIGGMPTIFRNVQVNRLFDTGMYHHSSICSTYSFVIDSLNLAHHILSQPASLAQNKNYGVYALFPNKTSLRDCPNDVNNNSIVVKIVYGKNSFLFTGDIEREGENILSQYGNLLQSDVIKIPHHGSKTSSTLTLLNAVKPQFAVISLGKNNKFNFPSQNVIERLHHLNIAAIRTDENGAVIFRTNGKTLKRIR